MSENIQPERKFARKARKSIMAINSTQQSYKQMRLRNENKNQMPFKAGKIKYEAPKFLSTAMTPPRTRKNFMKKSSSAVNFRTTKNQTKKNNETFEEFKLEPIKVDSITELPFEPIKVDKRESVCEEEEKENLEEWMNADAEKFVPEPLKLNPLLEAQEHNDSMNEGDVTDDEDRNILEEIKTVKEKLVGIVGSAIYLNRKIPNVEKMLDQKEYSLQDVLGTWDVLLVNIEKLIERSKNDAIQEEE